MRRHRSQNRRISGAAAVSGRMRMGDAICHLCELKTCDSKRLGFGVFTDVVGS